MDTGYCWIQASSGYRDGIQDTVGYRGVGDTGYIWIQAYSGLWIHNRSYYRIQLHTEE